MLSVLDKWEEAKKKLNDYIYLYKIPYEKIAVSFSGGKDSTIVLKLIEEMGLKNKVKVVFFNTMMEYNTIYDFINEKRNEGWIIEETKPALPAPLIYKKFGKPFQSKTTSELLDRLQQHNFDFINDSQKSYEELIRLYPKCKSALDWYKGKNIKINCPQWLFNELSTNGLNFKVANKCCEYLKKKPVYAYHKEHDIKLSIVGIRQAEGGVRAQIYKGCLLYDKTHNNVKYFPLFWFSDEDVEEIIKLKQIKISDAYIKYGLKRTGCVGCPFSRDCNGELEILKQYEPNKYTACINLFKESYDLKNKKRKGE